MANPQTPNVCFTRRPGDEHGCRHPSDQSLLSRRRFMVLTPSKLVPFLSSLSSFSIIVLASWNFLVWT